MTQPQNSHGITLTVLCWLKQSQAGLTSRVRDMVCTSWCEDFQLICGNILKLPLSILPCEKILKFVVSSRIRIWIQFVNVTHAFFSVSLSLQSFWEMMKGKWLCFQFSSVQFSRSVMSDSLRPHEPQHARPPCSSPAPRVYPNSWPLSQWCHPTISSSVVPFSSCPQSFSASGSFQMSQLFALGGQSIGVSASTSVLPMNTQDWSLLEWTGWISLQSKGLSRVFSNTTGQKHQFFSAQLSL